MRIIGTFSLMLVMIAWSVLSIGINGLAVRYRSLAVGVEAGPTADLAHFDRIGRSLDGNESLFTCSRELVRSLVSIKLAALDVVYKSGNQSAWKEQLGQAEELLRVGLRCFPGDGNLWLRLAMVEFARAGPTGHAVAMLKLSELTAPSEAWIIAPRIALAGKLLDFGLPDIQEVLEKDVRIFLGYGRPSEVGALYLEAGPQARRIFDEGCLTR